jgi:hypothetical protein
MPSRLRLESGPACPAQVSISSQLVTVMVPAVMQVRDRDQCSFLDYRSKSGGVGLG